MVASALIVLAGIDIICTVILIRAAHRLRESALTERAIVLWSNPGERVLSPFMGVGSEVYGAVSAGRLGIGIELKPSYYAQAVKNVRTATEQVAEQSWLEIVSPVDATA